MPLAPLPVASVRNSEMPSMKMRRAPISAAVSRSRLSGERSSWSSTFGLVKMIFSLFRCCSSSRFQPKPVASRMSFLGDVSKTTMTPGSSCSSEALEPSPVLAAMGVDADKSLRPSVGWSSTDADIDAFLDAFPEIVSKLRALRG